MQYLDSPSGLFFQPDDDEHMTIPFCTATAAAVGGIALCPTIALASPQKWAEALAKADASRKQRLLAEPGVDYLHRAYRMVRSVKRTAGEGFREHQEPDGELLRDICEAWLHAVAGARQGDVVVVDGWNTPREILVREIALYWSDKSERPEDAYVLLVGPTAQRGSSFGPSKRNLTAAWQPIRKAEPSRTMLRGLEKHGLTLNSAR